MSSKQNEISDADLKQAFKDLQLQNMEMKKQVNEMDHQIGHIQNLIAHAELTYKEIDSLPALTNVYNSVGRMFLLSNTDEVKSKINKETKCLQTKINNLKNNKQSLEVTVKEKADDLRLMVKDRKEKLSNPRPQPDAET